VIGAHQPEQVKLLNRYFTPFAVVLIVAGLACLFTPIGTVLGVLSLITLLRPQVKAAFDTAGTAA